MKLMKYVRLTLTLLVFSIGIANAQQNTDYVDLGLPSGTLWATKNVGAKNPWDSGSDFQWGEIRPKTFYDWSTYKYSKKNPEYEGIWDWSLEYLLTKYCNISKYGNNGFTDGLLKLIPADDAATMNMGSSWRMPTRDEMDELTMHCNWEWTNDYNGSGVGGFIVRSKVNSDKHIFLPGKESKSWGTYGYYWSSSLSTEDPRCAFCLDFEETKFRTRKVLRYSGSPIRAVRKYK